MTQARGHGDNGLPSLERRKLGRLLGLGAAIAVGGGLLPLYGVRAQTGPAPREIAITAQRWHYSPDRIEIAAGEPVVLALRAQDFAHGFSLPDFDLRADLVVGQVVRVLVPAHCSPQSAPVLPL